MPNLPMLTFLINKKTKFFASYSRAFLEKIRTQESSLPIFLRPIFLGVGCIIYFALPFEPSLFVFSILCFICFMIGLAKIVPHFFKHIILCFASLLLGISVATWHTAQTNTQTLSEAITTKVIGRVLISEVGNGGRVRYTLQIAKGGIAGAANFQGKVRISFNANKLVGEKIKIGDVLVGIAKLNPPSNALYPRGFSVALHHWFSGIGGSGFYFSSPEIIESTSPKNWQEKLTALRFAIAEKIENTLPPRAAALASALIVGIRSNIDERTNEILRQSGLAHILAISGLHMGLVALTIMFILRFLFSLSHKLNSVFNIKKLAAFFALLAVGFYLLLSGSPISAQRAFIMIAIMLLAILFNRRAISLRNVAFAFMVILILAPHAILTASFQLSFVAVAALVSFYEALSLYVRKYNFNEKFIFSNFASRFLFKNIIIIMLTTLIAGVSTMMLTVYHFNHFAAYSVLANVLAMPIVSFLLVPAAIFSVLFMPFELHAPLLYFTSLSIELVLLIAEFVSQLGGSGKVGYMPIGILLLFLLGFILLCVMKSVLRLFGLFLIIVSLFLFSNAKPPNILIAERGLQVGVLENEKLHVLNLRRQRYIVQKWQEKFTPNQKVAGSAIFRCEKGLCKFVLSGKKILIVKRGFMGNYCLDKMVDIYIVLSAVAKECQAKSLVITADNLGTFGSYALYLSGKGIKIATANKSRPWVIVHGLSIMKEQ